MRENLRKSGIDIIGEVPWGTHFCQFYQTREDLIEILVPYFKAGLENNEFCVWITSHPLEVEEAKEALRKAVPDIDVYLEKGQIEIIPYTHRYLKEGIFDPDIVVTSWVEKINQVLAKGYDGLRAAGDSRWLEKEGWNGFVDYENKVDAIIDKYHVICLCPYHLDMCSTAGIIDVVSNHQFALIKMEGKWERIENSGRKRAEKEAIQAAKNWKSTFDAVPDLIAIIDDKYRVVRTNKAMAARLGLTPEECAGLTCYRVIHGTENPPSFCPNGQLLKDRAEHTIEICEDLLGGYFSVSTSSLHNSEGKLIGNVCVARDVNERKQEEHRILRYNHILEGINRIFSNVVQAKTEEEMGNACLSVALEVTGSQFGFINEMGADGLLHDIAKSELGWEQCFMYDKTGHCRPPGVFAVHGLYGSVINNEKGFFTNNPPSHPDGIGIPDGHPPITSFLGVPLVQEGKTIGLIAVANREGGYSSEQQEDLEAITPAMVQALQRKKAEQKRKQAEKALLASEERYRSLYENSLDGIFLTKPDGTILCANPQACQMLGMTEEEITRVGREGTLVKDEKLAAALEERRLTGRMRAELKHRRKDGSTFVCDTTSKLFVDSDGTLSSSLIIRDISERKKTEEALQASEEKFRQIVETANEGIWLIDSNERTTFVNRKMSEMLGYGIEEILEQSPRKFISPEFHEKFTNRLREHIWRIKQHAVDYRFTRKDGSELWCILSSSPLFDDHGKYAGSLSMVTDITERKKAEEALKKARENLEEKVRERTSELEMAYESLKASETGLAEAQKMAHIGNWEWDIATDKAYWSEEMYRIFKRDPQKLAPPINEYLSYIHPDDLDYYCKVNDYTTNIRTSGLDFRIVLANGEERTLHIKSDFIYNDENFPIRIKGIVQDITERKKTEEKMQILANAVESSSDAIITVSLEGIITSWNKAAEQVYGYLVEEVLGKDASILAPPHLRDETKKLTETVIQGEKVHQYETLRLRKDGALINVSITLSPVFDITGRLVAISGIVRDVTERIRSEEALRESEARMRLFYESDMLGVCYYNVDGSITDANDKFLEIVGYTREDLQAEKVNWNKMTPPEYRSLDEQIIAELKNTGLKGPKEKEYIRKDGSRVPVIVGAATFDKACNGGTAFVLDITENKKTEETLANIGITRKKEIHHRIKNNLQVISSLLDLQADKFDNPKVIEAFRESQNRVISMALIHEELYKGEGTDTLDFCEYIKELTENLFRTYRLNSKNIHLKMDLEKNALFNMDIAVPLGIIVNELVSNSLKHAFSGRDRGEIRIELRREENREHKKEGNKFTSFILTVSDNGIGIPENLGIQDLDTLGMQLITALVDQLDGKLELKRNNGTEFNIRFKVTEENNQISDPALQRLIN
jgi:PAS domain S-box-containing protein